MSDPLRGLTDAQREAAVHVDGPLLVLGGPGTGKTRTVVARFAWLVAQGSGPEHIALLASSARTAAGLRLAVEERIDRPYEELLVATVPELCERLLRDEAPAAGVDPFAVTASPADRLALLLERIDELPLRRHDFQGNPAALLAAFLERIDRLKAELVTPGEYAAWAERLDDDEAGAREREFAAVYRAHDALLAQMGMLDTGDLVLRTHALLTDGEGAEAGARLAGRFQHVLVDELEELDLGAASVARALAGEEGAVFAAADPDHSVQRFRGASAANAAALMAASPPPRVLRLERGHRCAEAVARAAAAVVEPVAQLAPPVARAEHGVVDFWRCENERAQAQSVAADIEALLARGVAPESLCILVRSMRREGQTVAVALDERAVPHRLVGGAAFFQRGEIRDVLAWLRLLVDPGDAGAVVRALARPPVELRSIDLARCIQIARRRKLDMVSGLVAATESPQIPPEARERILEFLKRHRASSAALDTTRPDLFVHQLIERLGLRRQQLFAAQADVVERLVNLAKFSEMASDYVRRAPQATPREFARYIAAVAEAGLREEEATGDATPGGVRVMAMHEVKGLEFEHVYVLGLQSARLPGARGHVVAPIADELLHEELPADSRDEHIAATRRLLSLAMTRARTRLVLAHAARSDRGDEQSPSLFVEEARAALGAEWQEREEELFGPAESLHATFRMLREELLETVARTAGRLGELRFDTDLDVSHAIVRYLELIKLAALIERPAGQSVGDALPELNARLARAVTGEQREIYQTSALDEYLLDAERSERRRAAAVAARDEPSLEAFLPRRGEGLVLSAGDVETYRVCPLRYKFARVFRIPTEPTIHQRFGILVHQVLERFHAAGGGQTLAELMGLLDAGWRRSGFGDSEEERQLREKAGSALTRYFERFESEPVEPLWFERAFSFPLGPHTLRGRVDRVDRLPDGTFELIDYKTGRPKTAAQLRDDVQLSLYAVGAREAWQLEASQQAYYYLLDDEKVPVEHDERNRDWVMDTVLEVAEGILAQGFEPTPSYAACSTCDFRIICPAAEK